MTEYLNIGGVAQSKLVIDLKKASSYSWTRLAKELHVNRSMIYFYRSGKCKIPLEKIQLLSTLSNIKLKSSELPFVNYQHGLKWPTIPILNSELAEFLGILAGDGCLTNHNHSIFVTGNRMSDYLHHKLVVAPLFTKLFGLETLQKIQKNGIHTYLNSKLAHAYLAREFSFPIGKKKGRLHVLESIKTSDQLKRSFLRGLFDTDGGVHRHHQNSVQLHITSYTTAFLKEVHELLLSLGFNAKIGKEDIWIFDRSEVIRFFNEIKPANPKHVYKFQQYLKTGIVPKHRDIDYTMLNARAGN